MKPAEHAIKPTHRSLARLYLGRLFYTCKRYCAWYFSGIRYAASLSLAPQPHVVFQHETPLLRPLRNVDLFLQENKKHNLTLAVQRINGITLHPGEIFSFWRCVGYPTKAKGYLPGFALSQGCLRKSIGGGLCQLSNLIYWMTLHTPLTVVERWRHSYDVFPDADRIQPFGSGATVAYNYIDLQICNRTTSDFQLLLHVGDTHLHGEWRCQTESEYTYAVIEKNSRIQSNVWGGYTRHNELFRIVKEKSTEKSREEYITENHAFMMYSPMLEK